MMVCIQRLRGPIALLAVSAIASCAPDPTDEEPARNAAARPLTGVVAPTDPRLETLRAELAAMVERGEVVSISVGVAKAGEVIWSESFGWADRESERPATPDTPYLLASLSKSVSATALMTLVDDGRIRLYDSVDSLIAPLALRGYGGIDGRRVTVRDLLHSSGGIPHGWFSAESPAALPERKSFLPWSGMVVFPPGEAWQYSNFSFGLTEVVVEAVTDQDYEEFVRNALFVPLGMDDASARYVDEMDETSAVLYSSSLARLASRGGAVPFAGLGMFASVNDLLAFGTFHADPGRGGPVSSESVGLMHDYEGLSDIFGLGWYRMNHTLVSNGSAGGTNTHLAVHRGEDLVVVALTNMTSQSAITDQVAGRILEVFVDPLPEEERYGYEEYAAAYENPYQVTAEFAGRWEGRLSAPGLASTPAVLTFAPDGAVALEIGDAPATVLDGLVFNTKSRFKGQATATFPALFPEDGGAGEARIGPNLLRTGDRLVGYLAIERSGEDYSYSVGVFAEFDKRE